MRSRRVAVLTVVVAMVVSLVTGCSPGSLGTAAIGRDDEVRIIGAVQVCRTDTGSAALTRGATRLATWHRSSKGRGTETWLLAAARDGEWTRLAPRSTPESGGSDSHLMLDVVSWGGPQWDAFVVVSLRDLAALPPGYLLVPDDDTGAAAPDTWPVRRIRVNELATQPCQPA